MIKVGDPLPNVRVRRFEGERVNEYFVHDLLSKQKTLVLGFPGAFTPTCDGKHLPSFVANADHINANGIERIIGVAVNDPWVMWRWEQATKAEGKVLLVSDGNAEFTRTMGLVFDAQDLGAGTRCHQFFLIANKGIVEKLNVEKGMGFYCTRTDDVMEALN